MKALVVRAPWATLIALGVKTIETRPFPPNGPMRPEGVRGLPGCSLERSQRIAIVAGAQRTSLSEAEVAWDYLAAALGYDDSASGEDAYDDPDLPLGAVVCTVTVDDALPIVAGPVGQWPERGQVLVTWPAGDAPGLGSEPQLLHLLRGRGFDNHSDQLPLGDFTEGRWGYLLSDPRPCEPIPCKGRQGVFELPAEIAEVLS